LRFVSAFAERSVLAMIQAETDGGGSPGVLFFVFGHECARAARLWVAFLFFGEAGMVMRCFLEAPPAVCLL
jgi:hypothetical protein